MLPFRRFQLSRILPSWWMAPWFLMLLGFCSSLFPEFEIRSSSGIQWPVHEIVCSRNIPQLTMVPLHPGANKFSYSQESPYLTQSRLNKARRWQTINFTGNGINDFIGLDNMRRYLQILDSDSCRETGVRISFGYQASFACFMEVLNTLHIWDDHKNYWLDVRHNPMTIYVVASPPKRLISY